MISRILVLQHHHDSPAGLIGEAMARHGVEPVTINAAEGADLPASPEGFAGLLILGGAMNAYADHRCRHFPALMALARRFAQEGRPVVGICLGGQLLARAFGARVRIGGAPEFGLTPLRSTAAAAGDSLLRDLPAAPWVMQWHDDAFELPLGATPMLRGDACAHQAFRIGTSVWAFQGHVEADIATMRRWGHERVVVKRDPEIAPQVERQIADHGAAAEAFGREVAARWVRQCLVASTDRGDALAKIG